MSTAPPTQGDSQWSRYEVFQQARPETPFANVGSVHAADAEIALQNARDVFVRRPETHQLWVVPASAILCRTAEEIDGQGLPEIQIISKGEAKLYHVFRKTSQRRSMTFVTHAGEVRAHSSAEALHLALDRYASQRRTYVWWIVPDEVVVATREEDIESMFEPAHDKAYRMPAQYRTQTMMRELEEQSDGD